MIAKFLYIGIWNFSDSVSGLKWKLGALIGILTFTFFVNDELCGQQNVGIYFLISFSGISSPFHLIFKNFLVAYSYMVLHFLNQRHY